MHSKTPRVPSRITRGCPSPFTWLKGTGAMLRSLFSCPFLERWVLLVGCGILAAPRVRLLLLLSGTGLRLGRGVVLRRGPGLLLLLLLGGVFGRRLGGLRRVALLG